MKKRKLYIIFNLLITFSIIGISIGYASLNTTSVIEGATINVRVPSDIRVTSFDVDSSLDSGISNYADYSISSVMAGVSLPQQNSSVRYKVAVTNFEGPEMGIYNISGLPENLDYEIEGYSLKDKICDDTKCSLGVIKEFYITIMYKDSEYDSSNTSFDIKLNLDFRPFYSISYENVSDDSYPISVIEGDSFSVSFPNSNYLVKKLTLSDGTVLEYGVDYTYSNNKLTVLSVNGDLVVTIIIAKPLDEMILTDYTVNTSIPSFATNVTSASGSGLFSTVDESGKNSYYFRGVINDNYVSFAEKLWRIVRINGDGSYRLILEGTAGTSLFYSNASSSANNTNFEGSIIKSYLEDWYSDNILPYDAYVDRNAIFWSDRSYSTSTETTSQRFYNGRVRINSSPPTPTLVPINSSDMFSATGATKGNKLLAQPIGLLTADEVVFAGGSYNFGASTAYYSNEAFYLYTDLGSVKVYGVWTMTPGWWNKSSNTYSTIVVSKPQAVIYYEPPGVSARSVRPVINLKSTIVVSGSGSVTDPYKVEGY